MGEIAEQLINDEMFGNNYYQNKRGNKKPKGKHKKTAYIHLSPSQRKISSIRKEIAILIREQGVGVEEARNQMTIKYGKGWRERGLVSNSENQWTAEELSQHEG